MTRINCIDPVDLLDQHLLAEYRELPRVFKLARKLDPSEVVATYRLGTGHVKFFYDKTAWLARRQAALIAECRLRGFDVKHTAAPDPIPGLDGDWAPDAAAIDANLERLQAKVDARPKFYRYCGVVPPETRRWYTWARCGSTWPWEPPSRWHHCEEEE